MSVTISGSGQIVAQVVNTLKSDTFTLNTTGWQSVTGLSATITPAKSTSKVLVMCSLNLSWSNGTTKTGYRITRNGTPIALGDAAGSRTQATGAVYWPATDYTPAATPIVFYDSPASTSAVVYQVQIILTDNTGTVYVNRAGSWTDTAAYTTSISTVTVMEISQ